MIAGIIGIVIGMLAVKILSKALKFAFIIGLVVVIVGSIAYLSGIFDSNLIGSITAFFIK